MATSAREVGGSRQACLIASPHMGLDGRQGVNSKRRNPPRASGGRGAMEGTPDSGSAGQRARLSPGESSPPLAAAAVAPQKGPALPGRQEAGQCGFLAPPPAGRTWLWLSRAGLGTLHQRTLDLALEAHALSRPPRRTGREGKSSFLPYCGL